MNKILEFIVNKRYLVLIAVTLFTIYSATLINDVNIMSDMTKLLPDDSQMKIGIDLMSEEFGNMEETPIIKVMTTDLEANEITELIDKLNAFENITTVEYNVGDSAYNKDNHSLLILNTDVDYNSNKFTTTMNDIETQYGDEYNLVVASGEEITPEVPIYVMFIAVLVIFVILFLMCNSWIEPFLYMTAIGIAVVINMGTNAYFEWVSETTFSIVAMLQLVLSIDYSIILANRYRQELALGKDNKTAMIDALKGSFPSIAGSSLTTVVGLAALVFMSFKIGPDMGLVLGKGVLISMITILTILPTLLLVFDKVIKKTEKKVLHIPMNTLSKFSFKFKKVISVIFVLFFGTVFILQQNMGISFLMFEYSEIDEVFPPTNDIVVLYNNEDDAAVSNIANNLSKNENIINVTNYTNTFLTGKTSTNMYKFISSNNSSGAVLNESMINLIYYDYYKHDEVRTMTLSNFTEFINAATKDNNGLVSETDIQMIEKFSIFANKDELNKVRTSEELATIFGMEVEQVSSIVSSSGETELSILSFLDIIQNSRQIKNSIAASNPDTIASLTGLNTIIESTLNDVQFSAPELTALLTSMNSESTINEGMINLVYEMYYSTFSSDTTWKLTIEQLFNHIMTMANNESYSTIFNYEIKTNLEGFTSNLEAGKTSLVGENYSLMLIETSLMAESDETNILFSALNNTLNEKLEKDYYLIGNTPMEYELTQTFSDELNKITILTALAIFVVVMITFKNITIPIILISLIQSAVYTTMVIYSISGESLNFMALLIVQSILMGATTDYAILFTSYYREKRKTLNASEALTEAYNYSIHTIFTSGLIMVLVTFICSFAFADPSIAQICRTISIGATCAIVLILLVLPGLIVALDKLTSGLKNKK